MTVSLAGRVPATFEIKSASLPLVALLLKSPDLALLAEEFRERFGEMPEFFDGDAMVLDLAPLQGAADIDFPELLKLLRGYKLAPVAVKGGSEEQMAKAHEAGLVKADEVRTVETQKQPQQQPQQAVPPPPPASALVIERPLRSGQQVYARGRDVVVLAMVNPGAEVIADGHIHVYAPLRGKAIAGARGDADARIFTLCLEPELVSIAGVYRTSEVPWPDGLRGKPAQLRLQGEKLVMEPINP
ncbi:septum site-determining protein MinC [Ramlibacter sp. G-1-2-2]|uniref:Probable septum site-determining protein MinC n=1 Tax=Ramlibacter agri TaxID=2728837 RepID=A0A848H400_9BURK|nr:septum site-determining protein MinC [Ramlibacter agri]NML42488.1 septum site-determining protein MinC [Ramlibacter agri]